ncbi:hypothetical protein K1719_037233 [Acacia pycnantha]|nr:hypothetical protein K1719_037233 [Acacia pycnantha]
MLNSTPAAATSPASNLEMYSPAFYDVCTFGGTFSCGLTHIGVTPLDLVKCNMQIDPAKYKSISRFGILLKEQGIRGFFRGWVPTLLGYSGQDTRPLFPAALPEFLNFSGSVDFRLGFCDGGVNWV